MSLIACDVSEFQCPVDDSYPHRWLILRVCDGSYTDRNVRDNLAWAIRARAAGRLDGFTVYVVFRPGMNATILDTLAVLGVPSDCCVMIDAETWGGQISGDHSAELNSLANQLAARQRSHDRVWGYGNRGDLGSMWAGRPTWLNIVVASYGGTRPTVMLNVIGWQYSDGQPQYAVPGLPSSSPPFGPCDHNLLDLPASLLGDDMAMTPTERAALINDIADQVLNKMLISGRSLGYRMNGANVEIAGVRADIAATRADVAKVTGVALTDAQVRAIADAVSAKMPGTPAFVVQSTITPK